MIRQTPHCDFCGDAERLKRYPSAAGFDWYACPACVELIQDEDWDQLTERSIAAHIAARRRRDREHDVLRRQVENLVTAFRTCCPVPA
jgi:hypothetical protein